MPSRSPYCMDDPTFKTPTSQKKCKNFGDDLSECDNADVWSSCYRTCTGCCEDNDSIDLSIYGINNADNCGDLEFKDNICTDKLNNFQGSNNYKVKDICPLTCGKCE